MFSLHAFASTTQANSSLTAVPVLNDPGVALSGNFLYVPILNNLIGAYAMGPTILRAQIQSPSLLADVPYDVTPVDANALPASPTVFLPHAQDPIKLVTDEPLTGLRTSTSPEQAVIGVWLSDGPIAKVSGRILRVRGTVATPTSANTWGNSTITLTNQLAEGTYDLVGARLEDAHSILYRFVFPGGSNSVRPGAIAVGGASKYDALHIFRNGNLGVWGTFSNRVLPTVDILNDGTTNASAVIILDLIKH